MKNPNKRKAMSEANLRTQYKKPVMSQEKRITQRMTRKSIAKKKRKVNTRRCKKRREMISRKRSRQIQSWYWEKLMKRRNVRRL
jgi:hypothetical protein